MDGWIGNTERKQFTNFEGNPVFCQDLPNLTGFPDEK
jgi:hypothetical protein